MPEQNKPFVVTDRRKFTMDGELRPDADPSPEREERATSPVESATVVPTPPPAPETSQDPELPPALTAEQTEQAKRAYDMTADRLDTAIRSANPGILQLGGTTQEGQQPQVDILGARQSIDMLQVLEEKTKGNLSPEESRLLESALFELRMAFLEVTQALARSAASKAPGGPGRPGPTGPSIVR
jgi:hypothetical protein